jgi:hypothetical protein
MKEYIDLYEDNDMSLDELQIRSWVKQWERYGTLKEVGNFELKAVPSVINDKDFPQYKSPAYELSLSNSGLVARSEGRDALERMSALFGMYIKLGMIST